MRVVNYFLAFLLPTLVLADVQTIQWDIGNISSLLTTLNKDAQGVIPGIPGVPFALQVQVDSVNLDQRLNVATKNANAAEKLNLGDTLGVGISLIALQPKITDTLKVVSGKNVTFGELGIIVYASLQQLQRDTSAFATALVGKLDPLAGIIAPSIVDSIQKAFNESIVAYESNKLQA